MNEKRVIEKAGYTSFKFPLDPLAGWSLGQKLRHPVFWLRVRSPWWPWWA